MPRKKNKDIEVLRNPPIIEGVLDIQLSEEGGLLAEKFDISDKVFNKRFSKKERVAFFESQIEFKKEQVSNRHGVVGFVYKNENNQELTQFKLDGFSYHNLKAYPGWPVFFENAMYAWQKYKKCRKKHEIIRLGLRFINLITIPKSCEQLSDYFAVDMHFPANGKLGDVKQFQYRYVADFPDIGCDSTVNFVQQPISTSDDGKIFILDIDISMKELPENMNNVTLEKCFGKMRQVKNRVFFNHLTDKTVEMFDE